MISQVLSGKLQSRAWLAAAVGALLLFLVSASWDGAVAGAPPCSTTTTSIYSVQVCLTQPDPGSTVSGAVTVAATATMIVSGSVRVVRMVFTVDDSPTVNGYTL